MEQNTIALIREYPMNSSVSSLYLKISSENGLKSWFADRVEKDGNIFIFTWDKTPHKAVLIQHKENKYVRFKWDYNMETNSYFEMRVESTELTGAITLIITDYIDESELEDGISIWDDNIKKLKRSLGVI